MKNLPLSEVYKLLEPGPVVLLTTAQKGHPNIMTMSWHMMVEFEPPLVACVVSEADYSFAALRKTKQCVISIPALRLAHRVVKIGNCSGRTHDKFKEFRLTALPGAKVKAPLIKECLANLECKVIDTRFVSKYNLFILQVVKAWTDPKQKNPQTLHHRGNGVFAADGKIFRLKSNKK
jgi:flavin reductase (DIM6/NTAB) family NADH-FMN oxidoreductase RutF